MRKEKVDKKILRITELGVLLAIIIIMGFTLPAAMGVYWLVGALISIAQTGIMQVALARSEKNKKHKK